MANIKSITIRDAKIHFPNFAGLEKQFNAAGQRNFVVELSDEDAQALEADGWTVKWPQCDPEDPDCRVTTPRLKVGVRFDKYPPNITVLTTHSRTKITEETAASLDQVDIAKIDLVLRPYDYPAFGTTDSGTKAMLKTMFVTINEDELEREYAVDEADPLHWGDIEDED